MVVTQATVRSEAYVQGLRSQRRTLNGSVVMQNSPETLWPVISNTDQINAAAGLPAVAIQTRAQPEGGSQVSVSSQDMGMALQYEELPYEWLAPFQLSVERIYTQGPVHYICFESRVKALESGGTEAVVSIHVVPRWPWLLLKPKLQGVLKRILAVYQRADQRLRPQAAHPPRAFLMDPTAKAQQIESLSKAWQGLSDNQQLKQALATYVYTAPAHFVQKLRPFELASFYGLDRNECLRFLLQATEAGFFNMSWDLLCPSCQGAKSRQAHLSEVNPNAHCEACGIDFGVRFDENFELTFYPVPTLRPLDVFDFCAGSPANTSHLTAQFNLWPEQSRELQLQLPPGNYRFRCLTMKNSLYFTVSEGAGQTSCLLNLTEQFAEQDQLELATSCQLKLNNQREIFQTLQIENLAWRADRVTAAYVSSLQVFRNLFGAEVLRPGVNLEISNLSIMFTDLKDSTAMYEVQGDAFAFSLVQEHFDIMEDLIAEYSGGIVKTIGDAIMAVFQDPEQAMACAICIQEKFQHWNRKWHEEHPDKKVILKMGLHLGPCIALNLNDKLDYFGTTINKAARIQGESIGNDIVISKDFLAASGVKALLPDTYFRLVPFEKNLKGLSGQAQLFRIEWQQLQNPAI